MYLWINILTEGVTESLKVDIMLLKNDQKVAYCGVKLQFTKASGCNN